MKFIDRLFYPFLTEFFLWSCKKCHAKKASMTLESKPRPSPCPTEGTHEWELIN